MKRGSGILALVLGPCLPLKAGIADADTIYVSTIAGPAYSNGIALSSSVYFTPGSSLTLQGAEGTITTASSVTGSAFLGDGSHLAGIALLNSSNTLTWVNIFTSIFTVQKEMGSCP